MIYQVLWDNGIDSDVFPWTFDSYEQADWCGKDWILDMEADDPDGIGEYEFEIIVTDEPEEQAETTFGHEIEGTIANFERYVG